MRLNRYIALATGKGRRTADELIAAERVKVNDRVGRLGEEVSTEDIITLDNQPLELSQKVTIMLNKPVGYVCSREGQGNKTIYDLLPIEFRNLKPVGRLDKDSSGLLLMTNDGQLAQELTHPRYQKEKVYEVEIDRQLSEPDRAKLAQGVELEDDISHLRLEGNNKNWIVTMTEGRNRQIRRTFAVLGYSVTKLHRTNFGPYKLNSLNSGRYKLL